MSVEGHGPEISNIKLSQPSGGNDLIRDYNLTRKVCLSLHWSCRGCKSGRPGLLLSIRRAHYGDLVENDSGLMGVGVFLFG